MYPTLVAPSLLASDFSRLAEEIQSVEAAGADWLHLDVMDGHFVDNISFGPAFVAATHKIATVPTDVHLMISRPDHFLDRFLPHAKNITVHLEATHPVGETLQRIRAAGLTAGLAISPGTPFPNAAPFLEHIDLLLIMTVHPGFGGQAFIPASLEKITAAASWREKLGYRWPIQVDGGIQADTARLCRDAGASILVAGSSVFSAPDRAAAITSLRRN